MIDCDFNNADLRCPRCGFVARKPGTRRNCRGRPAEQPLIQNGPGTALRRIFASLGLSSCWRCGKLAHEMDTKGVPWCRDNTDYIVSKIKQNAKDVSWSDWFMATGKAALAGYRSLGAMVEQACQQAEAANSAPRDVTS